MKGSVAIMESTDDMYNSIMESRQRLEELQKEAEQLAKEREAWEATRVPADSAFDAASYFAYAVIDLTENAKNTGISSDKLLWLSFSAFAFAAASIVRANHDVSDQQIYEIPKIVDDCPDNVNVNAIINVWLTDEPLENLYPSTYLSRNECGPYWHALSAICKMQRNPEEARQTLLERFETFIDSFAELGDYSADAQIARNKLVSFVYIHLHQ